MNWLTKIKTFGDKIKRNLQKKFPTKEEIASSEWTSCCKGPILKKRFRRKFMGMQLLWKNIIELVVNKDLIYSLEKIDTKFLKLRVPAEDPLNWKDTKTYKERLIQARKKTGQNCAVMIATGQIDGIQITAGAINFDFIGGSVGAAEGEAIIYGVQHAIDNKTPYVFFPCGGGQRMFESPIALANMTRTTLAINELKKKYPSIHSMFYRSNSRRNNSLVCYVR